MEPDESSRESVFERVFGRFDDLWVLTRLGFYDRVLGPLPERTDDLLREHERERLRRAFPTVDIDGISRLYRSWSSRAPQP